MKYIYIANLNLHDKREARSLRSLANYITGAGGRGPVGGRGGGEFGRDVYVESGVPVAERENCFREIFENANPRKLCASKICRYTRHFRDRIDKFF